MLRHICALVIGALSSLALFTSNAWAVTSQRTFVASHGNDANPCTLALPCRGFAAAVAQTSPAGEVIVLDSAGYGPVTVTQSISIIAPPGVYAGISVPATGNATGVLIATADVAVVLRGLTINSIGGKYGVRMTDGAKLSIETSVISNFGGTLAAGVSIETAAFVTITGSTIRDGFYGVDAGYGAIVNIANSQVLNMTNQGILLFAGNPGNFTGIFISDTLVTGSGPYGTTFCVNNLAYSGTGGVIEATRVTVTSCHDGFANEPADVGTMTVSHSTATNNAYGFVNGIGTFQSLGDNHVYDNGIDIVGTITVVGGH